MRSRRVGVLAAVVAIAGCAHNVPPAVMPADGSAGRDDDRLELGNRYNRVGPQRPGTYRGGRAVPLDEFLRLAGHADVADAMESRRWLRRGLVAGGVFSFAAGVAYAVSIDSCDRDFASVAESNACLSDRGAARRLGLGIALVGTAMALAGLELSSKRPSWDELTTWAAAHNRRYRIAPRGAPVSELRVAPSIEPHGAGLIMSGRF